ncbi:MAG: hypothetical protein IJ633_08345 [Prevotella sp.]|nr:hypothetical protein [Prevotella sp.]
MFTKALIGCRLQSTDLLTPVDKVADSMSTDLLTLSQQGINISPAVVLKACQVSEKFRIVAL